MTQLVITQSFSRISSILRRVAEVAVGQAVGVLALAAAGVGAEVVAEVGADDGAAVGDGTRNALRVAGGVEERVMDVAEKRAAGGLVPSPVPAPDHIPHLEVQLVPGEDRQFDHPVIQR